MVDRETDFKPQDRRTGWIDKLEGIAERLFHLNESEWPKPGQDSRKVVHDAVLGSRPFEGWEWAIINTPALQRLRSIRQLSMAYLVFPTAVHTRFEHSLGVASIGKDMLRFTGLHDTDVEASENTIAAALLHDIGHGPFSHLSEEMYSARPDWFEGVLGHKSSLFPDAAPHEALGALLLQTAPARAFFEELNSRFDKRLDSDLVGSFITGKKGHGLGGFSSIVNGPTDADKVDYLVRDAYFSGIPLSLDVNRLLLALEGNSGDALTVGRKGVVPAEQITFAKATLTSALYHHHKVRASDCAFKAFAHRMIHNDFLYSGMPLDDPADMLQFTDADILSRHHHASDERSKELVDRLRLRQLPVSVLSFGFADVDRDSPAEDRFKTLDKLRLRPGTREEWHRSYEELRALAERIHTSMGDSDLYEEDIWVDMPRKPKIGGVEVAMDDLPGSAETFPSTEWTRLYGQYKYRANVFAPRRVRDRAAAVAGPIIRDFGSEAGLEVHT